MESNNYEWFITQTVESMLPTWHDENICLGMKIKMDWDYHHENEELSFDKEILVLFRRPMNYTQVLLLDVTEERFSSPSFLDLEMKQMSYHDSCWRSDGMRWIFKSFCEAWDFFEKHGIEGRDINPMFHYSIFGGAPAYYKIEKWEKDKEDDFKYHVKLGEKIPMNKISQYMKND